MSSLTKNFETEVIKGIFPHDFINSSRLEFIGDKPGINDYKDIRPEDYESIPTVFNVREECIKYLEADCVSLHQVLVKFQSLALEHTGQEDPLHSYTIASYANKALRLLDLDVVTKIPPLYSEYRVTFGKKGGKRGINSPRVHAGEYYDSEAN